jgi:hypothetical protein
LNILREGGVMAWMMGILGYAALMWAFTKVFPITAKED